MNNKINYILPDFTVYSRNEILIYLYENHRYIFKDNINIYSFYGAYTNAIWNGGGHCLDPKVFDISLMKFEYQKAYKYYKKHNIKVTFTFTNQLITEKYLDDEQCNLMLEVFHDENNEVLVVSPVLEKYIRKNYPKYKIDRSIINTENGIEVFDNYNLTVLSKFKNKDIDYLKSLPQNKLDKLEILCNELCVNNCPYAYQHYREHAYIQLNGYRKNDDPNYGYCKYPTVFHFYERRKNNMYYIEYDDIVKTYLPLGIKYYKLSGRGPFEHRSMALMLNYLIKEEYRLDVLCYLFERMIEDKVKDRFERYDYFGDEMIYNSYLQHIDYI